MSKKDYFQITAKEANGIETEGNMILVLTSTCIHVITPLVMML